MKDTAIVDVLETFWQRNAAEIARMEEGAAKDAAVWENDRLLDCVHYLNHGHESGNQERIKMNKIKEELSS